MEVRCDNYRYVHTQVRRKTSIRSRRKKEKPDVHLLIIDSMSAPQVERTYPRTVEYLRKTFGAVSMRALHRVGDNSEPNMAAFMYGELSITCTP